MDLTTSYPRSVRDKMLGIVQLGRTLDKAKAVAHGKAGEYHYNCPMDVAVFTFLGIDHEKFLDVVKNAKDDAEIEAYAKQFTSKKSAQDLEQWNAEWLKTGPAAGSESHDYFMQLRGQVAPDRTDVTSWADLLDLDEKRSVPQRVAA